MHRLDVHNERRSRALRAAPIDRGGCICGVAGPLLPHMAAPGHSRAAESRSALLNVGLEASIERLLAARAARQLNGREAWLPFLDRRLTNGSDAAPNRAGS
jgi:hypothetical protein